SSANTTSLGTVSSAIPVGTLILNGGSAAIALLVGPNVELISSTIVITLQFNAGACGCNAGPCAITARLSVTGTLTCAVTFLPAGPLTVTSPVNINLGSPLQTAGSPLLTI